MKGIKDVSNKLSTYDAHYTSPHGAWCNDLEQVGALNQAHVPCARRFRRDQLGIIIIKPVS